MGDSCRNQGRKAVQVCLPGRELMGHGMTEKVVWHVAKEDAARLGLPKVAPHDLRRSCARLCHSAGGELELIQFLLGHVSVKLQSDICAADSV